MTPADFASDSDFAFDFFRFFCDFFYGSAV